jgi:hypothetical protein
MLASFVRVIGIAAWSLLRIDMRRRDELRPAVGADPYAPGLEVDDPVVVAARRDAVVSIGRAMRCNATADSRSAASDSL